MNFQDKTSRLDRVKSVLWLLRVLQKPTVYFPTTFPQNYPLSDSTGAPNSPSQTKAIGRYQDEQRAIKRFFQAFSRLSEPILQ
jgi:hypothetical protein